MHEPELLCGCSDNLDKDLAGCKLTAIELYRPSVGELAWDDKILNYVGTCMTCKQRGQNGKQNVHSIIAALAQSLTSPGL